MDVRPGHVTLDSIVKNALLDEGEVSLHKKKRYLQWAIRGLKDLNYDVLREIRTIEIDIESNHTAPLPNDFIAYTKIGQYVNGRVEVLGLRDNIALVKQFNECGEEQPRVIYPDCTSSQVKDTVGPVGYWFYNYRNGENVGQLYGIGGGYNSRGYYKLNKEDHRIELSSEVEGTSIILEYITNGLSADGKTSVHAFAEECLIAWCYYKSIEKSRTIGLGEKARARKEYYNYRRIVRSRMQKFTYAEFLANSRKSYHQSIKH